MERASLNAEGALYEAVSRGNKDTYFFKDDIHSALNPFEQRYGPSAPVIHELRRIPPLNGADFGRSSEFTFDVAGDIITKPTILIDLPSWIPPEFVDQATQTQDLSGYTYGYTSGIAYFLFNKIQLYQDKVLLYEYSGDVLFASRANRGSLNHAYMENRLAGFHDGSPASIAAAAVPGRLRLEIPFISPEFPSIAMRSQGFKLRVELRKLEDIVECSNGLPALPWTRTFTNGADTFASLSRIAIGQPTLQLEARHIYTDGETQVALRSATLEMPFSRLYENTFTYSGADYAALIKSPTNISACSRRLDGVHPSGRLLWFFRSQNDLRAGRRYSFTDPSGQEYYLRQSLIIAGRDREPLNTPLLWNIIMNHSKESRDPGPGLSEMNWDLGVGSSQPEGSVNFGTADRPTFYTELAPTSNDLLAGQPSIECTAIIDSWALYMIEKDRGMLKYGN
jgi:hypothetical protein